MNRNDVVDLDCNLVNKRLAGAVCSDLAHGIRGELHLAQALPRPIVTTLVWTLTPSINRNVPCLAMRFTATSVGKHRAAGCRAEAGCGVRHQGHLNDSVLTCFAAESE